MYVVSVVLPEVQRDFGVSRADASLPYTLMMLGFGAGGLAMGKLADRWGVHVALWIGAMGVGSGFVLAGLSPNIWLFALAHGLLMGAFGSASTFAPCWPIPLYGGTNGAALRWRFAPVATMWRAVFGQLWRSRVSNPWAGAKPTFGLALCVV